jgi:hypothetical protein
MTQIVLTAEQSALLGGAEGPIVLVNPQGQTLRQIPARQYAPSHFTPEEIAEAEANIGKDGPYITTAELLDNLRKLDPERAQ